MRQALLVISCSVVTLTLLCCIAAGGRESPSQGGSERGANTATPIKHLVVIINENVSFDHYFGTYPTAANPPGEPQFIAAPDTPPVNGLSRQLRMSNPNRNAANGRAASNPFRLDRSQAATSDQNHTYAAEQQAYHDGAMDLFPKYTGEGSGGDAGAFGTAGQVMGYFDGNTVTALWNYAQHFAMSDNAYTSTYGPSTPGALNLVSGQTNGMRVVTPGHRWFRHQVAGYFVDDGAGGFTLIGDVDPAYDLCSGETQVTMPGRNIGDLLNERGVSWGGFMGGFDLTRINGNGTTGCNRTTVATAVGAATADYLPHHNWFQYYRSTSNPKHLRPGSVSAIGHSLSVDGKTDPANHQYDINDFFAAVNVRNFPAVSFLKAPGAQDGHAGYSDPLDEQLFTTRVINFLQQQPEWESTAVIVVWDDSGGWYDHAYVSPTYPSFDLQADRLNGRGRCGRGTAPAGVTGAPVNGRCGPGTRIPFVVISPWARQNFVDHTLIVASSVIRFIEDNWLDGRRLGGGSFDATAASIMGMFDFRGEPHSARLFLNPLTGIVIESVALTSALRASDAASAAADRWFDPDLSGPAHSD
ncbi:Non-hemolytic phospholipase C [Paraburkholderia rhynchosiae]|uniref:Phospholipase n=1 Tax=Paraburkholderia rhynchosiae TaxID=487049 RepID=A0A2N7WDK3_9BURK|nr:phospholipase [Paraburkholderia rhynchosiae]CAB3724088.1 Non-hemolytic phospholipase C [Paraburkholderia rhynchosiae]